jgi:hypothetical protein
MISDFDVSGSLPASILQPPALTTRDLALIVDQHVAALWRGDENIDHAFFSWLASWWRPSEAPEPGTPPSAVSVLGAGGVGIRWYETPAGSVGYVEGRPNGCYRVPTSAVPPRPDPARLAQRAASQPGAPKRG